jgi:hypothetical protein
VDGNIRVEKVLVCGRKGGRNTDKCQSVSNVKKKKDVDCGHVFTLGLFKGEGMEKGRRGVPDTLSAVRLKSLNIPVFLMCCSVTLIVFFGVTIAQLPPNHSMR